MSEAPSTNSYEILKTIGLTIPGDTGTDPSVLPSWVDQSKLSRAREVNY